MPRLTSTTNSIIKSGGVGSSAGWAVLAVKITFDPTAASASTGVTLPSGAVVVNVYSAGGATGGTNPTVDIGTSGDPDAFANELDADGLSNGAVAAVLGVSALTALSADTLIYAGVGASAATGGTCTVWVEYFVQS